MAAKAVRIIVPFPPGGSADLLPRALGESLQQQWGQPVIVDNRPGAAGNIGAAAVFQAEPDGYTLLSAPPPPLVINRLLYPKLAYDSTQFVPMTVIAAIPNVLLVHPKVGVDSVGGPDFPHKKKPWKAELRLAGQRRDLAPHCRALQVDGRAGCRSRTCPTRAPRRRSPTCWAGRWT